MIAWLRLLADPSDAAAAVRALSRPPVELRSVDLARCTTIARRRKLDMVSALEASLESPQIPPEARDRIRSFLDLYGAAARAMGQLSADVFVRRLIERVGFRRQRLFAAHPEAAERLRNLSRLGDVAAAWARREPGGSNRDFVRYLVAVSEAGVSPEEEPDAPHAEAVRLMPLGSLKGLEFDQVYAVGMQAEAMPGPVPKGAPDVPMALGGGGPSHSQQQRRLLYTAMTRARARLVLSRPEAIEDGAVKASPFYDDARAVLGAPEQSHDEELYGPAEGLHATYRMIQDEVLEEAWRAGGQLNEPRLDTAIDVNRAVARFLELLKLAALIQRPGSEQVADSLRNVNDVLAQAISPEQRQALLDSALDGYLLDEEGESTRRRELIAARDEPSLEAFLPKRGEGLALSATDIELYRTCPLKYKFARVFGIPQEQTINQRFGIVIHQVLERYHSQESTAEEAGGLNRLMSPLLGGLAPVGLRRVRRRAPVPRSGDRGAAPLSRARIGPRLQPAMGRAQVRLPGRSAPPAGQGRPGRRAARRPLRADRLQDRRPQAPAGAGVRHPARHLPPGRARGLAPGRGLDGQLLVRAGRREGRRGRFARRPRAGGEHGAGGGRGHPRPGLRAPTLAGDLLVVRLQADLPGV